MKLGMLLHPERGMDAVLEEAKQADRQGFDSVWVSDHLMDTRGDHHAQGPYDSFTLMTAVGAVTSRTRLAWAMLNPSFRHPTVLAKMLTTLDHITHGRVICTIGAGWFKEEYAAYDLPLEDDHDGRIAQEREIILLFKQLWTHPAPETVTFKGQYVHCKDLPFNPAPYQQPHPPIWIGGDSEATLDLVRDLADGWVMLTSGNPETLRPILAAPNWPTRPMTLVRNAWIFVAETHDAAVEEASRTFAKGGPTLRGSVEDFLKAHVVGDPDDCMKRFVEMESWGVNYLRANFGAPAHQDAVARLLLPLLNQ